LKKAGASQGPTHNLVQNWKTKTKLLKNFIPRPTRSPLKLHISVRIDQKHPEKEK